VNTLKTAALLAVLLGVLYGVYVVLTKPEPAGDELAFNEVGPPLIEYNGPAAPSPTSTFPSLATQQPEQSPATIPSERSTRGGAFQPNVEISPSTEPSPAGGLARSTYEAPATGHVSDVANASLDSAKSSADHVAQAVASESTSPALAAYALRRDMTDAGQLVADGKPKAALAKLSPHHRAADLPADQRAQLLSWLDALAAKVIYSREHLLASAYQVRKGETLFTIAEQYHVSHRLLQSINNREVSDPAVLVPGTELKVVPGPFTAEVNLSGSELTLWLGELYAGRFTTTLGDQPPRPGDYQVVDKQSQQRSYYGLDGRVIAANDPNNPYGGWWISLGGEVCIHGSPAIPGSKALGCISLSPQDAKDVYGILSMGSDVKIRQ